MFWVVSYDIVGDKRRDKIAKILEGYGKRAQRSVFECDMDEAKAAALERVLGREMDEDEDDIRFYPLNGADIKRVKLLGKKAKLYLAPPYDLT